MSSYCNTIPTPEGGTHETGLRAGLGKAVRNFIDTHNLSPKGVTLTAEDIREGLQAGHWAPIQFGCNPVMVDTGNVDVDVGALAAAIDRGSRMP